jgi:citrate lyase subunit beta/citryl-CoA lyase
MSRPMPDPAMLFCPADRPDLCAKALAVADVVILGLEDAIAPANRATARAAPLANPLDPGRVIVRINPVTSHEYAADLLTLRQTEYRFVMAPKVETPDQIAMDLPEVPS